MVISDDFVTEKPQDACKAVPDDCGTDVADVHGLGDIGRAEVDDDGFRLRRCRHAKTWVEGDCGDLVFDECFV